MQNKCLVELNQQISNGRYDMDLLTNKETQRGFLREKKIPPSFFLSKNKEYNLPTDQICETENSTFSVEIWTKRRA